MEIKCNNYTKIGAIPALKASSLINLKCNKGVWSPPNKRALLINNLRARQASETAIVKNNNTAAIDIAIAVLEKMSKASKDIISKVNKAESKKFLLNWNLRTNKIIDKSSKAHRLPSTHIRHKIGNINM